MLHPLAGQFLYIFDVFSLVENFLTCFIRLPGRYFLSSCRNGCEATAGLAIPNFPLSSIFPTENSEEPDFLQTTVLDYC
jgi:hypothetical protein